ncbi:glucosaminidase domain-containing protein [Tenacibaculum maritimum]|uniref:glucosaminidase domain-containing protein n=1 Tax=Tenacibaculum maritimum TaxID=107401 RepID=UPI0012E4695C|nr:glucosaminidase domain-containing protein [Tenacibaculum maritimum]CAA0173669.1 Endo-beta-N-acetylglucosaminidase-CBM50-containing protein, family GH73-CBM50 [Tenacibaculum maritimum]
MKVKSILIILVILLIVTSCSTRRSIVRASKTKIVLKSTNEQKTTIPQITPIKKVHKTNANHTLSYIQKFAPIAVKEMHEYKIPASITLAQGVLESGSGRSPLAIRSNNHFGIKCHKGWEGKRVTHDDDEIGECFRKYKYPETSYEDHSKFLVGRKRYAKLFKLRLTDYKGWAYGLRRAGYATDKRYPQKLIHIINKYELYKYDKVKKKRTNTSQHKTALYHIVKKGETLYGIARKYNTSVEKLKLLNKLNDATISIEQELIIK